MQRASDHASTVPHEVEGHDDRKHRAGGQLGGDDGAGGERPVAGADERRQGVSRLISPSPHVRSRDIEGTVLDQPALHVVDALAERRPPARRAPTPPTRRRPRTQRRGSAGRQARWSARRGPAAIRGRRSHPAMGANALVSNAATATGMTSTSSWASSHSAAASAAPMASSRHAYAANDQRMHVGAAGRIAGGRRRGHGSAVPTPRPCRSSSSRRRRERRVSERRPRSDRARCGTRRSAW